MSKVKHCYAAKAICSDIKTFDSLEILIPAERGKSNLWYFWCKSTKRWREQLHKMISYKTSKKRTGTHEKKTDLFFVFCKLCFNVMKTISRSLKRIKIILINDFLEKPPAPSSHNVGNIIICQSLYMINMSKAGFEW